MADHNNRGHNEPNEGINLSVFDEKKSTPTDMSDHDRRFSNHDPDPRIPSFNEIEKSSYFDLTEFNSKKSDEHPHLDDGRSRRESFRSMDSESTANTKPWAHFSLMWQKLANADNDFWENAGEKNENVWRTKSIMINLEVVVSHPRILLVTIGTFAALCAAGIMSVKVYTDNMEEANRARAIHTVEDTNNMISREWDKAFLPLLIMAQFVHHLEKLKNLPFQIGQLGDPVSAPPLEGKEASHRNVTGICDDPDMIRIFNDIVSNTKPTPMMEKILVSAKLAPKSVTCLIHPLINTEHFKNGNYLDNTADIGHDILNDENWAEIAKTTVPALGVVISGPLSVFQGDYPVVPEAFIARLPIIMEGYGIIIDRVEYPVWGFASIILNWKAFKDEIRLHNIFSNTGMEFVLVRTDSLYDVGSREHHIKNSIAARSEMYQVLNNKNSVNVSIEIMDSTWNLKVGFESGFHPSWTGWAYSSVLFGSFFMSSMLMMLLIARWKEKRLLYRMMPRHAIKKMKKGKTVIERFDNVTIFFSDIIEFESMSSTMNPIELMALLNRINAAFDIIAIKHEIQKVESIGNDYVAVAGGPDGCLDEVKAAEKCALFALEVKKCFERFRLYEELDIYIRCGLATGNIVAGVVGHSVPQYSLFGDTVNFASRMKSTGKKLSIQISEPTHNLLKQSDTVFDCQIRTTDGRIGTYVKGKGWIKTWWLQGDGIPSPTTQSQRRGSFNSLATLRTSNVSSVERVHPINEGISNGISEDTCIIMKIPIYTMNDEGEYSKNYHEDPCGNWDG